MWSKQNDYILELDFNGMSGADISRKTGVKYHTVHRALSDHRVSYFLLRVGRRKFRDCIRFISIEGHKYSIGELSEKLGISRHMAKAFKYKDPRIKKALDKDHKILKLKPTVKWRCPKCKRVSKQPKDKYPHCPYHRENDVNID